MAFQTREFISILAGMINRMRATQSQITDFNVGGVARALLEAPSIELEALYVQFVNGLIEAIPAAVYTGFGFDRLPAAYAAGVVRFTGASGRDNPVVIPMGTLLRVPGTSGTVRQYQTTAAATLATQYSTVSVRVQAVTAGAAGNTLPLTITEMGAAISGIASVTNPAAIASGRDEEADGERRDRFVLFLESLARGTLGALEYAARSARIMDAGTGQVAEYVSRVGLEEDLPGRVALWLYGSGGPVSDSLKSLVESKIDGYYGQSGYRAAGIQVKVQRLTEQPVAVTLRVQLMPGAALNAAMRSNLTAAAQAYLESVIPGDYVRASLLISHLLQVQGVASVDLLAPSSNVLIPVRSIPTLGVMSIS